MGESIEDIRLFINTLVKTLKSSKLYTEHNEIVQKQAQTLYQQLTKVLIQESELVLNIFEEKIQRDEDVVYTNDNPNESLAFQLFRDGMQQLTFAEGLTFKELEQFMNCLNKSEKDHAEDDLGVLLWEADFAHIRYIQIEEKGDGNYHQSISGLVEAPYANASHQEVTVPNGEAIDVESLKQPLSAMPTASSQLNDQEYDQLQKELSRETERNLAALTVDLVFELLQQEDDETEVGRLKNILPRILAEVVSQGNIHEAKALAYHASLIKNRLAESATAEIWSALQAVIDQPDIWKMLIEHINNNSIQGGIQDYMDFLIMLPPSKPINLLQIAVQMKVSRFRRMTFELVYQIAKDQESAIIDMTGTLMREHPDVGSDVAYLLGLIPTAASANQLKQILQHPKADVREEAVHALSQVLKSVPAGIDFLTRVVSDKNAQVRSAAMNVLAKHGGKRAAEILVQAINANAELEDSDLRHMLIAATKADTPHCIQACAKFLEVKGGLLRGVSSQIRSVQKASISALQNIGSEEARHVLEQYQRIGDRTVSQWCKNSLSRMRGEGV